jgi:S1-C subfamily serine protease
LEFKGTKDVQPSTVKIVSKSGKGISQGSGVLLGHSGYIATCAHVVGDEVGGGVRWLGDPAIEEPYEVKAIDKKLDVAILQIDQAFIKEVGKIASPLTFVNRREKIKVGTLVAICGYPWITETRIESGGFIHPPSITLGVVSLWRATWKDTIMLSANLHPGISGGPVYTEYGVVLGLASRSTVYAEEELGNPLATGLPLGYGEMIPMPTVRIVAIKNRIKLDLQEA